MSRTEALGRRGLSLAETVVAGTLLSLLLIAVLNLFPTALTTTELTRQRQEANLLAKNAMEYFVAQPFSRLALGTQDATPLQTQPPFTLEVTISSVDGYSVDYLKRLSCRVTWDYRNRTREVIQEVYVHPAGT